MMTTIRAIVRNGRIEVEGPMDLPEGTVLTIPVPAGSAAPGGGDDEPPDTPEAIEAWIRWYDTLEPVEWTPDEYAAWQAARRDQKLYELSQWDDRSRQIEGRFP
jgi:hypothetical protein